MAPTAPDEATPGLTPPPSPDQPTRLPSAGEGPLPWQNARPSSSVPGERNSWLYIPLLHAGAGNLSARAQHDWRSRPGFGPRFSEFESLLRDAPPVPPSGLAQTLLAVAECEAHDAHRATSAEDRASAATLSAMPDAPLPLSAAVSVCMAPDGSPTAAAQAALLESYAGATAAAAARSLADDARSEHQPPAIATARRSRRGRRRHRSAAGSQSPTLQRARRRTCPRLPSRCRRPRRPLRTRHPQESPMQHGWPWTRKFRRPVPMLQDVPPFMRAAARAALTLALRQLHDSSESPPLHDEAPASRAWKLFPRAMYASCSHAPPRDASAGRTAVPRGGFPTGKVGAVAGRSTATQLTPWSG